MNRLASKISTTIREYQMECWNWAIACFGTDIAMDRDIRNARFIEEALELVQSLGMTQSQAHQLVEYVFTRATGEASQEMGGVLITLAVLAAANDLDMNYCGMKELHRIWEPDVMQKINAKSRNKPAFSTLPLSANQILQGITDAALAEEIKRRVNKNKIAVGMEIKD